MILPRRRRPTTRSPGWMGGPDDTGDVTAASFISSTINVAPHLALDATSIVAVAVALDFSKDDASTRILRHLIWRIPRHVQVDVIDTVLSPLIDGLGRGLSGEHCVLRPIRCVLTLFAFFFFFFQPFSRRMQHVAYLYARSKRSWGCQSCLARLSAALQLQ
ncbi:hypothetical protein SCLCIDRAFT_33381 [Scleroderma citrinum Foug A]|uniref:Uncharacterized protein n=1 Tax=Scleroderma citrinum Foug A TaxID=1036808 RepID=A0A0C2YP82_9AGAM|nr:hypothetical protein SCLCIDRAFT_33381 [Scleroderma citrinum Foug A]